ncbi:uncharacterized protein LOC131246309 [Magnolia sinica]|uniref:uncharacterized protein LOC131246309 n=1 Tax=Magnolia sinica TaxID=86752 RepID=UPI00265A1C12|nr:uncharacterized protein LOC131246309 [Magnolia sinica]
MTVFGHSGGGFLTGKQVFPVDYESDVSHRLVEASHCGDLKSALECIADPFVDVNCVGAVCLRSRKAEVLLHDESADEVRVVYEEFKTDVSPLFLAVHAGNLTLVRKLLSVGADVNQKLFRGFATTAAVREDLLEILEILLKAGASQPACEEALLEASCHGRARLAELLMGSDMIRHHVAVHALVTASCRGFVDVVHALIKCGVNADATDRMLLRSSKPSLHTNTDCTALISAIVSRQVSVVRQLLQAGVRTDTKVSLGAWSWDTASGEEFRVGAGLAEPYSVTWCAVEYFEASGYILRMLLQHHSPNALHFGRTLIHHAILCANAGALAVLLECGADAEFPVKTTRKTEFRPIHMAARLGLTTILQSLISAGCNLDSRTESGDTAMMLCARYRRDDCLRLLAAAGADFGLVNLTGQSVGSIAGSNKWALGFQQSVLDVVRAGKIIHSSNESVFSPLMFVSRSGNVEALTALLEWPGINLDEQDENGISPVMVAAMEGHVEAFRLLVFAGADVRLCNRSGETAISLSEMNNNRDLFEKVMLEFALEKGNRGAGGFYALHCAARRGDAAAVRLLTSRGYDVNIPDGDGYTPLMLAAREGHGSLCELLISCGALCEIKTARGETALSLARKNCSINSDAERVILDELARKLVLSGGRVLKHTKCGKGAPHRKEMRMVGAAGVLRWGKSSRRNVMCREAEVGPSSAFQKNRWKKGDAHEPGVFRVVTTKNREFHFVCEGGVEMAELWVRGIKLVTREIFGKGKKC